MIHYIKGVLGEKLQGKVVVETAGIGYQISVPDNCQLYLATEGDSVKIYTVMIVREDDISLYGFEDKTGLELFNKLITVNGVGAKAALAILSVMPTSEVKKAIVFEDVSTLTRANGIGKKTAQRIVLDLKDKLESVNLTGIDTKVDLTENIGSGGAKTEAIDALMALGYSRIEAAGALTGITENELTVEDYIKLALKKI